MRQRLADSSITPYRAATDPLLITGNVFSLPENIKIGANINRAMYCLQTSHDSVCLVIIVVGECIDVLANEMLNVTLQKMSILVWGGISSEAHTDLVVIRGGRLTADR